MTFRQVCLPCVTFLLLQPSAHSSSTSEIPFRLYRGHWIMLEATLFDRDDKLRIVLDTGAQASFINLRTARRLKLPLLSKRSIVGAFGKKRRVKRAVLRGLSSRWADGDDRRLRCPPAVERDGCQPRYGPAATGELDD
ncbi:MAG: aspartyl protease family protein [Acidobacteriota bacterium]